MRQAPSSHLVLVFQFVTQYFDQVPAIVVQGVLRCPHIEENIRNIIKGKDVYVPLIQKHMEGNIRPKWWVEILQHFYASQTYLKLISGSLLFQL